MEREREWKGRGEESRGGERGEREEGREGEDKGGDDALELPLRVKGSCRM